MYVSTSHLILFFLVIIVTVAVCSEFNSISLSHFNMYVYHAMSWQDKKHLLKRHVNTPEKLKSMYTLLHNLGDIDCVKNRISPDKYQTVLHRKHHGTA